jgi:diaminopimelate decarboxylase
MPQASPNAAILKVFLAAGLHVDASSAYEVTAAHSHGAAPRPPPRPHPPPHPPAQVWRALAAGFPADKVSLSTQELPTGAELRRLLDTGVHLNCCSLNQVSG